MAAACISCRGCAYAVFADSKIVVSDEAAVDAASATNNSSHHYMDQLDDSDSD